MKRRIMMMVLVGIMALFVGCKKQAEETEADVIQLNAKSQHQMVEAYGVLKAAKVKDVILEFPAVLEQINVKNGQRVSKDDPFMTLNTEDYRALLKEKEVGLSLQKQQIVASIQQNVAQKEQNSIVLKQEGITKEQKKAATEQEKALAEQAKVYELQMDQIAVSEENMTLQKSKLENDNFKENQVLSDIENGLVYNMEYVQGDMAYSGARLLTIADLDSIVVQANIDQQFINWVKLGAEADVVPEYDKSALYKGKVTGVSAKAFQVNGETVIPVEITFNKLPEALILDTDVQIKIYPAK